jgi:nucleoid-associated protein YgaU
MDRIGFIGGLDDLAARAVKPWIGLLLSPHEKQDRRGRNRAGRKRSMAGWVKAILFLLGGGGAAAGTAYVTGMLDPWLAPKPAEVSTLLQPPAASQEKAAPAEQEAAEEEAAPADEPASPETATTPKQDRLAAPAFDLLRVEPDGSVLVAGKAGAGATVEVLSGETVLGKAEAGASGDFVVVLDERLAPGDYRLALRATAPEGGAALSDGAAIVSVPEAEGGQVLAMVEEPGEPAQLITVPGATDAAPETTVAPGTTQPAGEEATAPSQAAADERQPAAEAQAPAVTPDATDEAAASEEEAASASPQSAPQPAPQDAATHTVSVEAVEIEGGTIFVAGRADTGRTVRVYAGAVLLGDAVASEGGRFLVEAKRDLEVGSHLIRADLLGDDGSVVARAGVPFEREPGETIAAVAPAPAQGGPAQGEPAAQTAAASDAAGAEEANDDVGADDEATAAPLQRVDGAVIIRRGDSLWRISRRVYGHGIRYSTIYLANQDQIHDPNRIWPGQVFAVPGETPEGEQADLDAIGDQAVSPQDGNAAAD